LSSYLLKGEVAFEIDDWGKRLTYLKKYLGFLIGNEQKIRGI